MNLFPLKEKFEDFKGDTHTFEIHLYKPEVGGYSLIAKEVLEEETSDRYEFRSYSGTSESLAYSKLIKKIQKNLSICYLKKENGDYILTHDKVKGRIGYNGIVVNGTFIPFEDLTNLIQTYEGFDIKIVIADSSDSF